MHICKKDMNNNIYKRILVIGMPNVGKTSIINCVANCNLKVGNFAGVTTDIAEIMLSFNGMIFDFIDTPGIYSIRNPTSRDEEITTKMVYDCNKYDIILNVIDTTKLETSLLLTSEIIEIAKEKKIILCFNSINEHSDKQINIDTEEIMVNTNVLAFQIKSCNIFEKCKNDLLEFIAQYSTDNAVTQNTYNNNLLAIVKKSVTITKISKRIDTTKILDSIFLNKFLGIPSFILIIFIIFKTAFIVSDFTKNIINTIAQTIGNKIDIALNYSEVANIINDGIFQGMFGLLQFLPSIGILFFFISFLEKSGYMSRIAFLMDTLMRAFGLNGKAVIPFVTGFSCSIPAYLSARILPTKLQRISAMFAIGFMTCSAKFTFFMLLVGSIFSATVAPYVLLGIYFISALTGLLVAFLINCLIKDKSNLLPYTLEMPKYKIPNIFDIFYVVKLEIISFLKKAGGMIVIFSSILWLLSNYPVKSEFLNEYKNMKILSNNIVIEKMKSERLEDSFIGKFGKAMHPIFSPIGFDWKMNIAVISGLVGKEVGVVSLGVLYGNDNNIDGNIAYKKLNIAKYTGLPSCLSLIAFFMYYIPCISAVVTFSKEIEYKNATLYLVILTTLIAWFAGFFVYNIAHFFTS